MLKKKLGAETVTFFHFLRDRLGYICFYVLNLIIALVIVKLSLLEKSIDVETNYFIYIAIISFVLLLLYCFISYVRQKPFFDQFHHALNDKDLHALIKIDHAITYEQKQFYKLCLASYNDYLQKLHQYEAQQKQAYYFTNRWTHQMKTPLSVMQLLIQEENNWSKEELLEHMEEEIVKLTDGMQMMLSTIRLQKFELDFSIQQVPLIALIRSLLHEKRKTFIRYHVFPKLEAEKDEIWVESDQKWLTFVLEQLLNNALKYSQAASSESKYIIITVTSTEKETKIGIKDEGIGIKKEDVPRVFDAFFTGENGRKLRESTGMGLYLAKHICDKLKHTITIDSKENSGTTAAIHFLPRTDYYDVLQNKDSFK